MEPLATKVGRMKEKYEEEIKTIQKISQENVDTMKVVENSIKELEQSKLEALEISQRLRKQAILDIKEYFDSIDAKIISFINDKREKLEKKRIELQSRFQEITSDCENVNDMLLRNSSRLLIEGEDILKKVQNIQTTSFNFEREKIIIEIAEGALWNPANVATLNFKDETHPRAYKNPATSLTETTPGTLSGLANKTFKKAAEVELKYCPQMLRAFENQL